MSEVDRIRAFSPYKLIPERQVPFQPESPYHFHWSPAVRSYASLPKIKLTLPERARRV